MARSALRTRKSAIAEYWLGTPEGRERLPGNAALVDSGEPSCFACGWMASESVAEPVRWRAWEQALLERCHLIPHALGGRDSSDNLVLLCGRCHREAPDVDDADYMLCWIGDREAWGSALWRALDETLRQAGITEAQIGRFADRVSQDPNEFEQSMRRLLSEFAVPVGRSFSTATLAACSVELVARWTREPAI